jgi:prepilin-type N-terminal cleavage/methylation domain-containing protein
MLKFLSTKNLRGKGFTLIEILYVLSILSILAAIAIFNYSGYKKKASDTVAQEDLRQAYSSAVNYFTDHPSGILTLAELKNYGFSASPNVKVMIINGRLSDLLLISSYNVPGSQIYVASRQGMIQPGTSSQSSGEPDQGSGGGTGAPSGQQNTNPAGNPSQQQNLATNQDVVRLCNQATLMDLQEAYSAAQAYLGKNPGQAVTKDLLFATGYSSNENVSLVILNGTSSNLSMSANFNFPGTANYTIGPSGISSSTG